MRDEQAAERRPNRFDRPREPHDWRWFVGGVGRMLVSVGVLLFAFVGYQLWGTGIQTAAAQDRLSQSFDDLMRTNAGQVTVPVTTTVASTVSPVDTSLGIEPPTTAPVPTVAPLGPVPVPMALAVAPTAGDPLARIEIAAIGLDNIVVEGVSPDNLKSGPGHFPETPLPGQLGNVAIAGHRTTYGQPFIQIDEIPIDADIVVTTPWGRFTYVVTGTQIVGPDDYSSVIPTREPLIPTLVLTSCHPKYSARQRYVVTAMLDSTRSDPIVAVAPPGSIAPPVPIEPTATVPTETVPTETVPTETVPTETVPTTSATNAPGQTAPPSTVQTTTGIPSSTIATEGPGSGQGAFTSHWFSDPDAFVPVALWGFRLMIIAFVATALSRIARRNWVGALIGVGPFVVTLYFFFENLSRLLPANL